MPARPSAPHESPTLPPTPDGNRVAVLLRTHLDNNKVRDSIAALAGGSHYDFHILAHEEPGRFLDFGEHSKISHSLQTFRDLGFEVDGPRFLTHCADLLFAFAQHRLPGYAHYVIVEYDVFIQQPRSRFFDRAAEQLALAEEPPDFLAAWLSERADPDWMWTAATSRVYGEACQSFFPLVALSAAAISAVFEERLKERDQTRAAGRRLRGDGRPEDWMFCEAFTPAALKARGGFRLADWNSLMPGAYAGGSFGVGPPRLLAAQRRKTLPVELIHPVLDDREFLEKGLLYSGITGTTAEWLAEVRRDPFLPDGLRREFEAAAEAHLAAVAGAQ